ncbi:hypothetical protein SAMN04489733_0874 [Amycolatopsis keratiniphila]|nr:hypothetical protein SAMN04489733_0874 [Amycolatopsis keratiniphila]
MTEEEAEIVARELDHFRDAPLVIVGKGTPRG